MNPSSSSSPSPSMFGASSSSAAGSFMAMGSGPSSSGNNGGLGHHQQLGQEDPELCLVCNDVATGYHYGTPSCNGCKTFFRRTVMKKQVFQCQYDGNCPVDKSVRCACRHCRFKKCLSVGMNKDAIQQNRDPIGYTKRTRRYPLVKQQQALLGPGGGYGGGGPGTSTPFSSMANSVAPSPFPGTMPPSVAQHQPMLHHSMGASSSSASSSSSMSAFINPLGPFGHGHHQQQHFGAPPSIGPPTSVHQTQQQQPPTEQVQEDLLLQRLIGIENILVTIRKSKVSVQKSLNDLVLNRSVFEDPQMIKNMATECFQMPNVLRRAEQEDYLYWHERDWFIMIEWAKMLPVYQQLSVSDKLALLRHSAITYPSLIQCFYTPDVGPDTIVFPNGAFFDRTLDPSKPTGFQRKNFKMLDNLLNPIRKMQIDQNEFSGAKGIFFLNPDSDADDLSPEAKAQIAVARSAITNALYRYMVNKRGTEEAADKFGKLLLLGTAIATMSCEMKEAVVVADFFDQIRFSGFARQLLLAKDEEDLLIQQQATVANTFPQQQQTQQRTILDQPQHQQAVQQHQAVHQQQAVQLQQPQYQQAVQQQQQHHQAVLQNGVHHQFFQLPPVSTAPIAVANSNVAAATMAMLNGLNVQMQQLQQQQQYQQQQQQFQQQFQHHQQQQQQHYQQNHLPNNLNLLNFSAASFSSELPATTQPQQQQQQRNDSKEAMLNKEEEEEERAKEDREKREQLQKQLQQQLMAAGQTQLAQTNLAQTQLCGPQSVQTLLPPQDQLFSSAMFTSLPAATAVGGGLQQPQPPSAQSQQSYATTSPPSLINLT